MARSRWLLCLTFFLGSALTARAGFDDNFATGINSTNWTLSQTTAGLFSVVSPPNVQFSRTDSTTSGLNNVTLTLNLAAATGLSSISGDFSVSVDFSGASLPIPGSGIDQIELHTGFDDGSIFYDSYSNERGTLAYHVWNANGQLNGFTTTPNTSGTFTITRVGDTLSGYYDGSLIYSETNTAALNNVAFTLQNFNGSDPIAVTFGNFTMSYSVPEPASIAMVTLGLAAVGLTTRRSLRKRTV